MVVPNDRVMRLVVGSLLSSNLSSRELRAFAVALQRDPYCAERLGLALDGVIDMVEVNVSRRLPPPYQDITPEGELGERLYRMVEERNITTSALVTLIRSVDALPQWTPGKRWPKRKIVESFVESAPGQVVGVVIQKLSGDQAMNDPYLAGLSNREKR